MKTEDKVVLGYLASIAIHWVFTFRETVKNNMEEQNGDIIAIQISKSFFWPIYEFIGRPLYCLSNRISEMKDEIRKEKRDKLEK